VEQFTEYRVRLSAPLVILSVFWTRRFLLANFLARAAALDGALELEAVDVLDGVETGEDTAGGVTGAAAPMESSNARWASACSMKWTVSLWARLVLCVANACLRWNETLHTSQ